MLKRRKVLLAVTLLVVGGSLTATVAYGLHLRSRGLRERIAADVSRRLGLDVAIDRMTPLSFSSRRFNDITIRLPDGGTQLGQIGWAVWRADETASAESFGLDIGDGWLLVGTGHWTLGDYERLLKSGFGHDFAALHLTEINVHHVDFRWQHPQFSVMAPAANGTIFFDEQGRGRAALTVYKLNETTVDEPIYISAWFTPGADMAFQKVEVRTGELPLAALDLEGLLGRSVATGTFAGNLAYRDSGPASWEVEVGGALRGARLEELTGEILGGPFTGGVDLTIDRAVFSSVELHVRQADYERPHLRSVRLSGRATDVSLEALTRLLGYGVVTGRLEVRINALAVVDDGLQFADVDLIAVPPDDGAGFIEKSFLASVAREAFHLDLEPILPERVEYVQMGAKLLLDGEGLRIRGTHGTDGRTLLTVRLLGQEVGLLQQPDRVYPVEDLIVLLRTRLEPYNLDDVLRWWKQVRDPPKGSPGAS